MRIILNSLEDTATFASLLASLAEASDVITLVGDLGAGKTAFSKAFINNFYDDEIDVPSPTFTLVQTYDTPKATIWHFDLYRLENTADAYELDIEDAFYDGISLIEWPDIINDILPENHLALHISFGKTEGSREVRIEPHGTWTTRNLKKIFSTKSYLQIA